MAGFTSATVFGYLCFDPQARTTQTGSQVVDLRVASNRKYRGQDQTVFVDISCWGKQGEAAMQYLHKGDPVLIHGRLHYGEWNDKNGQKRSKLSIMCNELVFMPRGEGASTQRRRPAEQPPQPPQPPETVNYAGETTPAQDDIPF